MRMKQIDELLEKALELDKKITAAEFGKLVKEVQDA